jgi:ABC-2 type transport system ATP-binding protein
MSIKVNNVSKLYGTQRALDQVSFEINSGEIVGLLGPNGAGKSTMMKIITCYLTQSEGEVSVNGFDVQKDSLKVRSFVGYLPENNPLYHDMYVKEYLAFVAGMYKIPRAKQRVQEMVDLVGLEVEQHKKIGALSKGYRQRVGIAQAMIHDPKVIILDEPTSGLDPLQLEQIRGLIHAIGQEKTVMLSTHIMQEVEALCSRVIIINKGKIVADKPVSLIRSEFGSNRYNLKVELAAKIDGQLFKEIVGVEKVLQKSDTHLVLEITSTDDIRDKVFQFAVKQNLTVLTIQKEEQSMEDVFKQFTN